MKVFPLALIVIALVLATLATIGFVTNRGDKLRLASALSISESRNAEARMELNAKKTLLESHERIVQELSQTLNRITSLEQVIAQQAREAAQTRNLLSLREQNEQLLNREIAGLKQQLEVGKLVEKDLRSAQSRILELEQVLALLQRKGIDIKPGQADTSMLVMAVGPESAFVVINRGSRQGIRPSQSLLVSRGTEIVAQVLTSDVREDLSIAQVEPNSLRSALHQGDSVLLDQ
jgi:DNA mismatch repair ATPase MutS